MKKRKLKKPIKIFIFLVIIGIIYIGASLYLNTKSKDKDVVRVINEIKKYNYTLDDNETKLYKGYFSELKTVLNSDTIDESKYAELVAQLFVSDFYNLDNKITKNDVGGTEYIYPEIKDNFILNAKDTLYKYIESTIYNERTQELPSVTSVDVSTPLITSYTYNKVKDDKAYKLNVTWLYDKDLGYQSSATIILIHDGIKLYIVELK